MSLSPLAIFLLGLLLLGLFGWYFATEIPRRKRWLGTALTVLLVAILVDALYPPSQKLNLGIDLRGGTSFLIRLVPEGEKEIDSMMVEQAVEVIRKRIDSSGVSEPVITPQGEDRILVQVPALSVQDVETVREQLSKVAKLEFKVVHPNSDAIVAGAGVIEPGWEVLPYIERPAKGQKELPKDAPKRRIVVKKSVELSGDNVTRAGVYTDAAGWTVTMNFDSEGGDKFFDLTEQVGRERTRLAIVLDNEVVSAPTAQKGIAGGSAIITGSFAEQEARNLASVLQNPLATPVEMMNESSVSATLGADSIRSGIFAGLLGLALTLTFVLFYYKFAGLIANIALAIGILLLFGTMAMFHFTLTLPGIAGIILTIGMAVDANVLIYERLREELAGGKPLKPAVDSAYDKAFSAIFDSNVTTLITAAILFWKATGPVKGFAVTLTVGILCTMFTALIVTRTCFRWLVDTDVIRKVSMWHLISRTNIDFLSRRRLFVSISALIVVAGCALFAIRGEKNFGYEFRGGDRLMLSFDQAAPDDEVRAALGEIGMADSVVQTETTGTEKVLTIRSGFDTSDRIEDHLKSTFPAAGFEEVGKERVGKVIGDELARASLVALGLSLIGVFIYVALRFEMSFAAAAIVALLHDVLITLIAIAVFGREISLVSVGAILTVAGLSINDTIVIFDRIREGIHSGRRGSLQEIMNGSINDTLSRTILTGGTTLLTALAMLLFGGPVLGDFGFVIMVGVIVGTYSSVFVAAPVVLWWAGHGGHKLEREVRRAQGSTEE